MNETTLFNQVKSWLLDYTSGDTDWYGDCSDGGYMMLITKNTTDEIDIEFNGATCYEFEKIEQYKIEIVLTELYSDHILIHFNGYVGHGTTHCTDLKTAQWYLKKVLYN